MTTLAARIEELTSLKSRVPELTNMDQVKSVLAELVAMMLEDAIDNEWPT